MNKEERKQQQLKLAKVFLEMGMDLDLISKISGLERKEFDKSKEVDKEINCLYNKNDKTENNSYSEPRD